ncbi:MAG: zinc-ribbon domain-containing protein [Deltaproteobacteria bacterium]|nr:zinc-ribbon domain-containing protein [Deltaproteobacteria bacterium]
MRVQCEQCGSSYTLPEQRVAPGRRLQFQCRHCQHRIIVHIPAEVDAAPEPAAAVPAAAPAARVLWFINAASGQQRMDGDGVRAAIAEGNVTAETWLWRKGMAEWAKAAEVPDFSGAFGEPSPTRAMDSVVAAQSAPALAAAAVAPVPAVNQAVVELARPAVLSGAHVAGAASVHKGAGFQTDQRAIPMPIIRVTSDGAEPVSRDGPRPRSGGSPLRPVDANRSARVASAQAPTPSASEGSLRPESRAERRSAIGARETNRGDEGRTSAYAAMPDDEEEPQRPERHARGDRDSKGPWSPATDTYQGQRARNTRKVDDRDRQNAMEWAAAMERRDAEVQLLRDSLRAWQRLAFAGLIALVVVLLLTALVTVRMRDAADEAEACKAAASKMK